MSPERRRNDRILRNAIVGMTVAVGVLIAGVAILTGNVRDSERHARAVQTEQLRAGCARGVARDFESLGTNRDLATFARDAAAARRKDGNEAAALKYEATAGRAEVRMGRIMARVPGTEDDAVVAAFCRGLYPSR